METWYRTTSTSLEIVPVDVTRSTSAYVCFGSCRNAQISSSFAHYHRTYAEARQFLIERAQDEVATIEARLVLAKRKLGAANAIPTEPPKS